jgi:hypothetical protein
MSNQSNLHRVWEEFFKERTKRLPPRFPGTYRAVVVETNDLLQIHRVRFKCPELHDFNLKPEECPWAVPSPWLGGKNTGSWANPLIGDIIFIQFEKNHPYGPIFTGFGTETRRQFFPLDSVYFSESPKPVDAMGKPTTNKPTPDWQEEYIPKDHRPMSNGWRDRYGSFEINCSVGFFPDEHKGESAPPGIDGVLKKVFTEKGKKPEINEPDRKYLVKVSKYGTLVVHSDVGYFWKKDEKNPDLGEFDGIGDPEQKGGEEERKWEVCRTFYFQQLLNEKKPNSKDQDQRRFEIKTRSGHKFEMRDVGWAQMNGGLSANKKIEKVKSRIEFENAGKKYGDKILSKWEKTDERWVKLRSKGGHVIQFMDMGFHPEKDNYYKRKLLEEMGAESDHEKSADWIGRDSRQIRIVTRWGIKLVLDDRGTHAGKADKEESPRGNGWLLKSRRSWEEDPGGSPRGFGFECDDKDELNTTRWYTPKSKIIEMNDRKDYVIMCTDTASEISREWKGLDENEFALKIAMTENPEKNTYHLKLDKHNGYLRLKTASGGDNGFGVERSFAGEKTTPDGEFPENQEQSATDKKMETADVGINQGLECRDNRVKGGDEAWTELVDIEDRGFWMTKKIGMGIWRSKLEKDQWIMIMDEDGKDKLVIHHGENGPIQIYCKENVQVIAEQNINLKATKDIQIEAGGNIEMRAGGKIRQTAGDSVHFIGGGGQAQLDSAQWQMNVDDYAPNHPISVGSAEAAQIDKLAIILQEKRKPADRAKVDNDPFDAVPESVVKGE